jgi:hypothetical protein
MRVVRSSWGQGVVDASANTRIPPAFLAALIAGESGGNNEAKRFEPGVLHALWEVLLGRKAGYGTIGRSDLIAYVSALEANAPARSLATMPADAFQRVDGLATSWGLTQIMGYHILERPIGPMKLETLKQPVLHLGFALRLLTSFSVEFKLDLAKDFGKLFRCWNTGQPDGKTFDPAYVTNGLTRMAIYTSLATEL